MKKIISILSLISVILLNGCSDNNKEVIKTIPSGKKSSPLNDHVIALGEIQPEKKIVALFAQTAGSVQYVYHEMGDTVRKGELIASLNSIIEEAQLKQAQSKLATQVAVIKTNKAQLASITVKSENFTLNYNRNADLFTAGAVTRQALDDSRFAAESGSKDVSAASAIVNQSAARLAELEADVAYAKTLVAQKSIRAPYDGVILSLDIRTGNYINANQSVGDFAPAGNLTAIIEVDELYARKIKNGMTAVIRPQGESDTLATGKVYLVSSYLKKKSLFSDNAANMEDRRVREVRVLLDRDNYLLIGSRIECVINIKGGK
ncbi:efflux RND transporter periplasmic adaptor subunit [Mucilaginibacter flavus]|uniref:efflux RND transporter periplasmic adaptor subunit n=1 Tax=Mucilaginibacter flavus TaxID=931504 RepID=UPI0025B2AA6B|nr:efflux RND transporter periplasmic adaptor subunit [Mucilaginibacter flavus]MDN3584570.1 efflux RND transporter periplasmic adaptor subunit [Mucilaginibacter flavus]